MKNIWIIEFETTFMSKGAPPTKHTYREQMNVMGSESSVDSVAHRRAAEIIEFIRRDETFSGAVITNGSGGDAVIHARYVYRELAVNIRTENEIIVYGIS